MGFYNAETAYEHTVFHFGVAPAAMNRTLGKFLAMLTKPHFDERRVQEEVGVVDQEFRDKLQDDTYRLDMISRVTGDANHPFVTNFGGNHATLVHHSSLSLQKALYSLHRSMYSSHRMRLVVMGPGKLPDHANPSAPISEQIETVVSLFDQVKESTFTDIEQADPFANEVKTTFIVTASVFESSKLLLQFKLPTVHGIYATKVLFVYTLTSGRRVHLIHAPPKRPRLAAGPAPEGGLGRQHCRGHLREQFRLQPVRSRAGPHARGTREDAGDHRQCAPGHRPRPEKGHHARVL